MVQLLVNTRFQDLFIPLSGFFSPFPHGTSSLSVIEEYLGLDELVHPCSDRISRVPLYSGTHSPPLSISLTGLSPSVAELSNSVQLLTLVDFVVRPTTPHNPKIIWFGLFPIRSPLLRESLLISLPQGT